MVIETEFFALVDEILEVPPGTVELASNLEELGWDSLSDLLFIAEADKRWKALVDPKSLAAAITAADLLALVAPERTTT